jgi:hypothetical protein
MEDGYILSKDNSGRLSRPQWVEGAPEKGGIHGHKVKGKRQIPMETFRCPRCGWLLWFAPEPDAAG